MNDFETQFNAKQLKRKADPQERNVGRTISKRTAPPEPDVPGIVEDVLLQLH